MLSINIKVLQDSEKWSSATDNIESCLAEDRTFFIAFIAEL